MTQDLQTQLAAAEAEVERLKKEIKEAESTNIYHVASDGVVFQTLPCGLMDYDKLCKHTSVFRTQQEAQNEALFRQMRTGVRVVEPGREYWAPDTTKGGVGFKQLRCGDNIAPMMFLAVSGLVFPTEDECRKWSEQWTDRIVELAK